MSGTNEGTRRVVINTCYGGFGLSPKAVENYLARKGLKSYRFTDARNGMSLEHGPDGRLTRRKVAVVGDPADEFMAYTYTTPEATKDSYFYSGDIDRDDPDLVAVVEELGDAANGEYANLRIVEIPEDVEWGIDEYDGLEHVEEKHRVWS